MTKEEFEKKIRNFHCTKKQCKDNFDLLTEELTYNYFACSFGIDIRGDKSSDEVLNKISRKLKSVEDRKQKEGIRRTRNILVVGAGVSMDSYAGIPGGKQLINRVKKEYEPTLLSMPRYQKDQQEIRAVTGLRNLSFENYLYILSKSFLTQKQIRKFIKDSTNFRYSPIYYNELVAHLLKHCFLDAVINFNFEETMDQAIEEELGEGNYLKILSDGDCLELKDLTSTGTLKTPIYIKPHGTNSHKSTLRFTNKHYFDIPDDISNLLKCLISGFNTSDEIERIINEKNEIDNKLSVENSDKEITKRDVVTEKRKELRDENNTYLIDQTNLILVGFNNESIEFLEILNNYLPDNSKIYYINYQFPSKEEVERIYFGYLKNFIESNVSGTESLSNSFNSVFKFIQCSNPKKDKNEFNFLDEYEKDIWKEVKKFGNAKSQEQFIQSQWNNSLQPLGRLFNYIYSEIYKSFYSPFKPQHNHRHKLNCLLFFDFELCDPSLEHVDANKKLMHFYEEISDAKHASNTGNFFLDKVLVEITISILRGHGAIDYFELLNGRVGKYYNLYVSKAKAAKITNVPSLSYLLKEFGTDEIDENGSIISNLLKFKGNSNLPNLKKGSRDLKNAFNQSFQSLLKNEGCYERPLGRKPYNLSKRRLVCTILSKLLNHNYLSDKFITRLNRTYSFKGFQRTNCNGELTYKRMTHIEMIIHSANYLVANNFFTISTHYIHNNLLAWQSFNLDKQIHTNLSLDYEIIEGFESNKNNVILSVSEIGGNIKNFIKYQDKSYDKNVKKIIQICSYEAVRQMHRPKKENETNQSFIEHITEHHRNYLCGLDEDSQDIQLKNRALQWKENLILLLIPFTLHSHHMSLFVSLEKGKLEPDKAVYIWRRGFSTRMNPMIVKNDFALNKDKDLVQNDLKALKSIFIKYFRRGLLFNYLEEVKNFSVCGHLIDLSTKPQIIEWLNSFDISKADEVEKYIIDCLISMKPSKVK